MGGRSGWGRGWRWRGAEGLGFFLKGWECGVWGEECGGMGKGD